ncbi:glutaminase a [Niveomyces insectorum RCEF 264]|uniref:Glutaminase a n=1 Tax=Niveomyces insectorum RCEF 264 TaxID=1081102 RepID=A0A167X5T2_9HYPO|nr:glutaminase a [Niveomyces insectorum RCEF 264]
MRLISFLAALATAAIVSASTLTPPVLPLLVRNPYLSIWLTGARENPWEKWPIFWTGHSVGFSVMASVPDTRFVFPLLGRPHDSLSRSDKKYQVAFPEYLGATFDASTTNLTYRVPGPAAAGGDDGDDGSGTARETVKVTLSFLSPITPTSTFRQSIPAAYLTVFVEGSFDVDLYVDLNGEWVSGNRDNRIRWDLNEATKHTTAASDDSSKPPVTGTPIKTWRVSRAEEQLFTEFADRAEWGTIWFSAPASVQHESGVSARIRTKFARSGVLDNVNDENGFRRIMEEEPIFAFSKSFRLGSKSGGSSSSSSSSSRSNHTSQDKVLFTFSLIQDPVVQFASSRGLTFMRPLWASYFFTAEELNRYHYDDFATASKLARRYADQLAKDAFASGSKAYEEIAALSARQILGATEFSGTPDGPLLFLKEISSNGNCQTVDVIFPAFPFFLYTNPRWLAYLLEPLLEHQLSGQYPNDYSMHDLGYHFPNQTGHADGNDEYMPVEECGNMLIMGLALVNAFKYDTTPAYGSADDVDDATPLLGLTEAQARTVDAYGIDVPWGTGTNSGAGGGGGDPAAAGHKEAREWVARSYRLWKQWTGYLVRESLVPRWQLSTDDFAGWLAYQTNLALKGIIGIRAMSEIAHILGEDDDAAHYRNISDTYIAKWQEYGISRDGTHAKLAYDWYGSWTTLYNLYADSLLCFHLPDDAASAQQQEVPLAGDGRRQSQAPLAGEKESDKDGSSTSSGNRSSVLIPDKIYKMQSDWYHYVLQRYGLPLDSRHLYAKSDWEFFAAAVTSKATRTEILTSVAKWLNETATTEPFTDLYDTEGEGGYPGIRFRARPVVGGHFAFLALERACGGKAADALAFLETAPLPPASFDVQAALDADGPPLSPSPPAPSPPSEQKSPEELDEMGEL